MAIHEVEKPTTTILTTPMRGGSSSGNWHVWLRDIRSDGSVVDYSRATCGGKSFLKPEHKPNKFLSASTSQKVTIILLIAIICLFNVLLHLFD